MTNLRILVVDDETTITDSLQRAISRKVEGSHVDTASTGVEAYKLVKNNEKYDFIITDVNMPEMNGDEFVKKIKSENLEHGKILIVSGHFDNEALCEGLCEQFYCKPVSILTLIKDIKEAA